MRRVREITAEEENFRTVPLVAGTDRFTTIKRDPVEPEPVGTIVAIVFRVTGYDQDCDGSLMARLERIYEDGEPSGWEVNSIGLYPQDVVLASHDELTNLVDEMREGE